MKRVLSILTAVILMMTIFPATVSAAQQKLEVLGYKFYPLRDVVFVDFYNPHFTPVDLITVDMVIREGTGQNRLVAIGQAKLPDNLVLAPGEHTSIRVPIRTRVVRDIPNLAQFDFRVTGRQLEKEKIPPEVVMQESLNGSTMEYNRDANGIPVVLGFIQLNPNVTTDTQVTVEAGILTFYDSEHQVVWSETLPIGGKLTNNDSLMIWGKFEQVSTALVPDIDTIDVKFVVKATR